MKKVVFKSKIGVEMRNVRPMWFPPPQHRPPGPVHHHHHNSDSSPSFLWVAILAIILLLLLNSASKSQVPEEYWPEKGPDICQILQELNTARQDPVAYGKALGIDLNAYQPAPALQWDGELAFYAQAYAEILYESASYGLFHSGMPYYESVLWNYSLDNTVSQFIIDKNIEDFGHRRHMLNHYQQYIGIGVYTGPVGPWTRNYVVILTSKYDFNDRNY